MKLHRTLSLLLGCFISVTLTNTSFVLADDGAASEKPSENSTAKKKLLAPEFSFRAKDGKTLSQLFQKNKWFLQFRQTGFYQGALYQLAPVLFSPADEYGSAANSWKGRLLDYLYSTILNDRPITLHYFRRSDLASPFVVSVTGLSSGEQSAAKAMIAALKSAEPQSIDTGNNANVMVTPLLVKQQKFGIVLDGACLTVGRAAPAVAAASKLCGKLPRLSEDAELRADIDEAFPPLMGLRERFLGLSPTAIIPFHWDNAEARLSPVESSIDLTPGQNLLLSGAVSDEIFKALPASSIFASLAFVPTPSEGFAPAAMGRYLKKQKEELRKAKPMPVILAYIGAEGDKGRADALPVVLINFKGATQATVTQLAETYNSRSTAEVFVRKVCANVIAISKHEQAITLVQSACESKIPSFAQLPSRTITGLKSSSKAGFLYLNPGKLMAISISKGWAHSPGKGAEPSEILESLKLVNQLPTYIFAGSSNDKRLTLKAQQ